MGQRQSVAFDHAGRVACITLNRPAEGNAINDLMLQELTDTLEEAERDEEVWVVLLGGAGANFCRGRDWGASGTDAVRPPQRAERPFMGEYYEYTEKIRNWWMWLWNFTKPIVTKVQGDATGWGADLVLVSHTSIAARSARIGDPSILMGLVTQNPIWSWRVGPQRARQCLMLGEMFGSAAAQKMGLITRVVADGDLEEDALRAAQTIAYQGGIVGWDGVWLSRRGFGQAREAARGITSGWVSSGGYSALSAIQRRGFQDGEFDFEARREAVGGAAAMIEMNEFYRSPKRRAE